MEVVEAVVIPMDQQLEVREVDLCLVAEVGEVVWVRLRLPHCKPQEMEETQTHILQEVVVRLEPVEALGQPERMEIRQNPAKEGVGVLELSH